MYVCINGKILKILSFISARKTNLQTPNYENAWLIDFLIESTQFLKFSVPTFSKFCDISPPASPNKLSNLMLYNSAMSLAAQLPVWKENILIIHLIPDWLTDNFGNSWELSISNPLFFQQSNPPFNTDRDSWP